MIDMHDALVTLIELANALVQQDRKWTPKTA